MSKTKTVRVSPEELAALEAFRQTYKVGDTVSLTGTTEEAPVARGNPHKELADAFVEAIERTKPPVKITIANRTPQTPWTPPKGTPRLKLKRKMYQHGMLVGERISNEEIALLNQLRPGHYCDGNVRVTLRKDRGIDIDYPISTTSQRLKLVNGYGLRSFPEILQRCIDEKAAPAKYRKTEDQDLYDLE